MLILQIKQLFFEKKLSTYWYARGVQTSLLFLFGAILKKTGHDFSDVFLYWSILHFSQSSLFLLIDYFSGIPKLTWLKISNAISLLFVGLIFFQGFEALWFTGFVVFMQPALRESIHESMIYVRERKDWALGVDVASAFLNEGGKAVGGFSIAVFGFLIDFNETVFLLALFFVAISLFFLFSFPVLANHSKDRISIGPMAKKYLTLSVIHNGAFFASQSFLSIVMLDKIKEAGFSDNVLSLMGIILSIAMISGLIVNNYLKKKLGKNINEVENSSMLCFALLSLTSIVFFINVLIWLEGASVITPSVLAIGIGFGIGFLQAIGGFFTIGTLQFLDLNFKDSDKNIQSLLKKKVLHWNMTLCGFSPGVILLTLFFVLQYMDSLSSLIIPFMIIILLIEISMSIFAFSLSNNIKSNNSKKVKNYCP